MSSLLQDLKRHEGLKLKPYQDTEGVWTIGFGHNLEEGITAKIAEFILHEDIRIHTDELTRVFPIVTTLDDDRRDVLINMCFNLGISRLKGFKKMWAAIDASDYVEASKQMLDSLWADQVGSRAIELAYKMQSS